MNLLIKALCVVLFLSFSQYSSAQKVSEEDDIIAKHLVAPEGKAIVYIMRPGILGFAIKLKLFCNEQYIGSTFAEKYVYTIVDSGKYIFKSESEKKCKLSIDLESGKTYYLKQVIKLGMIKPNVKLIILDKQDGKETLANCRLSGKNEYK